MKEKSQLEDMRAAIRGDLDRARARREADPWRSPEPAVEAAPALEPEPEPEPVLEVVPDPEREPEVVEEPASEPVAVEEPVAIEEPVADDPEPEPEVAEKRGFLAALFRRR